MNIIYSGQLFPHTYPSGYIVYIRNSTTDFNFIVNSLKKTLTKQIILNHFGFAVNEFGIDFGSGEESNSYKLYAIVNGNYIGTNPIMISCNGSIAFDSIDGTYSKSPPSLGQQEFCLAFGMIYTTSSSIGFGQIYLKRFSIDVDFSETFTPSIVFDEPKSTWHISYLNDKKMHAVSVGKTFQFTKIKNADGSPHTGGETETFSVDRGGLTATGFKSNPSEGLFLERSNELLPGTFVIGGLIFGSKAGNYLNGINNIINNATDPLSGVSQGAQAYVRNINENMSNVTKIISQGNIWTGTILKAKTFMSAVGSGSVASMSLLEAMGFGTMMGLSVIAGIELGNVVVDKVKEYVTPQGTYKLDKYSNLFDIYNTSDYIDGLIQEAEANANAHNESSATTHADNGTNSAEQIDEWEKQEAEAQAQADAEAKEQAEAEKATLELENEKLKSTLLKNATDYLSQITGILDFNFNNIPKKQDILDIDHEESTTTVEELNKAKRNMKAWENLHSQVLDNHTDTQGNEQEFTKGLVGILKSFAPATLNEHLTRITGKNMSDEWNLQDVQERVEQVLGTFISLFNIKEEDLPSLDSEGLSDFDKEAIQIYNALRDKKNLTEDVTADEGVV